MYMSVHRWSHTIRLGRTTSYANARAISSTCAASDSRPCPSPLSPPRTGGEEASRRNGAEAPPQGRWSCGTTTVSWALVELPPVSIAVTLIQYVRTWPLGLSARSSRLMVPAA